MSEENKIEVKINREKYVPARTASGSKSLSNGDGVATLLQGLSVAILFEIADKTHKENDFRERYGKLNAGMQRMNLGNRLRGWVSKRDAANEKLVADNKEPKKAGLDALEKFCGSFRKEADKIAEAAQKEKDDKAEAVAAAKQEKADKKAANKAANKVAKDTKAA